MAILDKLLQLSDGQNLTATGPSENVIDLQDDRDVGVGEDLYVIVRLGNAPDDASANETYEAVLQTDTVEGFGSPTDLQSVDIPRGSAAGAEFVMKVPFTNERYLRVNFVLGGTTPVLDIDEVYVTPFRPQNWQAYPDGQR